MPVPMPPKSNSIHTMTITQLAVVSGATTFLIKRMIFPGDFFVTAGTLFTISVAVLKLYVFPWFILRLLLAWKKNTNVIMK